MKRHLKPGMRILSFLLCFLCFCSLKPTVLSEEKENLTYTTVVRMRPSKRGLPIGQIEDGAGVTVLSSKGAFYKVDCYDMTGYIAKSQIRTAENGKCYVNCQEGSKDTKTFAFTDHAEALILRHSLLELARKQLGSRYVYGGARPGAFDCSGLTYYLYKQHGTQLQRRASLQLQNGIIVPKEALQVGDLVFFRQTGNYPADHVGIYAGNNQIIHASTKRGIEYTDLDKGYCKDYFLCARRIIATDTAPPLSTSPRGFSPVPITHSISGRSA